MAMKVFFEQKDRNKILTSIKDAMGGRKLAELVKFDVKPGSLMVTISKMGTSSLNFAEKEVAKGIEYHLESEKIALTHRAFKDEVTQKIIQVIKSAGGQVS